ncbi:DEAD/DEAH box helicase [Cyanobium sp. Morenito 9A2]|uniref:SNF2-related protein n=1 Tax=Cyanobium sp. Morenito 9A2 TaxID=2823718 RepID=UPI0020CC9AB3|nr:DEAD/DEAH box helicase [Cyanobium sp. Morenito 9A2]MCP9850280.1 DEAD/DEAH box helicase [Cyanobium sp. Morenito 9A2]
MRLGPSGLIEVVMPFDAVTQAQLRTIRPRGHWRARRGCWEFPLEAARVLQAQLGQRFGLDPELARWFSWFDLPLPPLPPLRELVAAARLRDPLADGRALLAHQRTGVRWLLARRGAVLADAMGLGKTLTALVAARVLAQATGCRVLVIAPVGLHGLWRQEAAGVPLELDLHSWSSLPAELPPAGTVLIADEAHYAQNLSSQRTRRFLRLARHPRLRAIWLLSGTPMKNGRPAQLFPLLAAIGHPLGLDQRAYEEQFCDGHWREAAGVRHWHALGASQLPDLRRLIRPLVLHRSKQACLDLPPKQRRFVAVELAEMQGRGFQHRLQLKVDDYRLRAARGEVRRDAEALAVLTALRQIGSEYKLPAAAELVSELLGQGESVLVFSAFVATAELLHAQLGGALLTGRQPPAERQLQVEAFQAGAQRLLSATFGAGGLGFTLHRARHVVLIERPWTPGDAEQAEDRCHRLGMTSGLTCYWLQLGVADQFVDGLIASKAVRIHDVLQRQALPGLARELLQHW